MGTEKEITETKVDTSQTGTAYGYRVEAMYDYIAPVAIGDAIYDKEWRTVHFREGHPGVPLGHRYERAWFDSANCMSYESAEALRWWFMAECKAGPQMIFCMRTRLVKVEIKYHFEAKRVATLPEFPPKEKGE